MLSCLSGRRVVVRVSKFEGKNVEATHAMVQLFCVTQSGEHRLKAWTIGRRN
jgi:hypothetical protein